MSPSSWPTAQETAPRNSIRAVASVRFPSPDVAAQNSLHSAENAALAGYCPSAASRAIQDAESSMESWRQLRLRWPRFWK